MLLNCSSDEEIKKEDPTCMVSSHSQAKLTYDGPGKLLSIDQTDSNGDPVTWGMHRNFEYNDMGKLSRIVERTSTDVTRIFEVAYQGNTIVVEEFFFPGDGDDESVDYKVTYTLDSEGKVVMLEHESWNLDEPYTVVYEYSEGNVVKETRTSQSPENDYILEFEVDDKLNPGKLLSFQLYLGDNLFDRTTQNVNNVVKSTFTLPGKESNIVSYRYTYNEMGYPTEQFANGESTASFVYAYECK